MIDMNNDHLKFIMACIGWYLVFVVLYLVFKKQKIKVDYSKIIQEIFSFKIKKKILVNYYGVDKTTFRKWIKYFCSDIFSDHENYLHKRSITVVESIMIVSILGLKTTYPICSKKYIVEKAEGSYRSLKESIVQYPEQFGITEESYVSLRVFPPHISKLIIEQYS